MKKGRLFYGWVVVLAGMCVFSVVNGIVSNCFSLFIKTVTEDMGFSRQGFSTCQTLYALVYTLIAFFWGKILRRFKLRVLMRLAILAAPALYALYAVARNLPVFYLISILVGVCQALLGFLPFGVIISNWFEEKRGVALGVAFMGSGVGGMLFNLLAGGWIESVGWRPTFALLALIMALVGIPLVFFVVREHPGQMNLEPYGHEKSAAAKAAPSVSSGGMTLEQARGTWVFWLLMGSVLLNNYATNTLSTTIAPHLGDLGYATRSCAAVVAAYMGALALCKILLGRMYDRLGVSLSTLAAVAALCVGLAALALGRYTASIPFIVAGAGLGCAFGTVAYPVLTLAFFGPTDYPAIYGIMSAVGSFTSGLSPMLNGAICDATGSYTPALLMALAMGAVTAPSFQVCVLLRRAREKKRATSA